MKRALSFAMLIFLTAAAFSQNSSEDFAADFGNDELFLSQDEDAEEAFSFADEMDDLDSLFSSEEDIIATQEEEEAALQSTPAKKERQVLTFYGSFGANALYSRQIIGQNEDKNYPAASLSYTLGGTLRPSDTLTGHFSVTTSFPNFTLALGSLYFDYDLFGKAYLTAGRTAVSWGNSVIFTTNTLDTSAHIMALLTVPVGRGQIEAGAHLAGNTVPSGEPLRNYIYYMASAEYPVKGMLYKVFARTWPKKEQEEHRGDVGLEVTGDICDVHITLHEDILSAKGGYTDFEKSNFVGGLSKWWTSPEKIGAVVEYQFIYDKSKDEGERQDHTIALQATWRHILGSRYTTSLYSSYSFTKKNAVVLPALSISGLPHASVNFAVPVLIGEGASWTLSDGTGYTVKDTDQEYSLESTAGKIAVFFSAGISLSFSH